ncbi:hypothetical protein ES703_48850 [subsurface metagenome]
MYENLGEVAENKGLNELEQISIDLLNRIAACPQEKSKLASSLGIKPSDLDRVVRIGKAGSYVNEFDVKGINLLVSPLYFAEKPEEFAQVVKQYGEATVSKVLSLFRQNQGWPLAKLLHGNVILHCMLCEKNSKQSERRHC